MRSILRILNVTVAPILTLVMAARFHGFKLGSKDIGDALGAIVAASIVLLIELALEKGPKWSLRLRRLLDGRGLFQGVWLQQVYIGPEHNRIACFSFSYDRADDSYFVNGNAYDDVGKRSSKWESTHMFFSQDRRSATYVWKGERLPDDSQAQNKWGVTKIQLGHGSALAPPARGEGSVGLVGESADVHFRLRRVTPALLQEMKLDFDMDALLLNERDEEVVLIKAALRSDPQQPLASAG